MKNEINMVDHDRQIHGLLEVLCVGVKYSLHSSLAFKDKRTGQRAFTPMPSANAQSTPWSWRLWSTINKWQNPAIKILTKILGIILVITWSHDYESKWWGIHFSSHEYWSKVGHLDYILTNCSYLFTKIWQTFDQALTILCWPSWLSVKFDQQSELWPCHMFSEHHAFRFLGS